MRGRIRWLSFVYMLAFAIVSEQFVENDFASGYSNAVLGTSAVSYSLMTIGNFLYATRTSFGLIRWLWKVVAPYLLLFFIYTAGTDEDLSALAHRNIHMAMTIWVILFFFFLPTFWANFRLAWGSQSQPDEFARPSQGILTRRTRDGSPF